MEMDKAGRQTKREGRGERQVTRVANLYDRCPRHQTELLSISIWPRKSPKKEPKKGKQKAANDQQRKLNMSLKETAHERGGEE